MSLDRRDALIGVGVAVGAAVLVLFLKKPAASTTSGGTGSQDIMGGFATASTVYVPTSEYNISYNKYKGAVSYATTTNNSVSSTTTTYAPVNSPINSPSGGSTVSASPIVGGIVQSGAGESSPTHITSNGGVINPPTQQTNTTPAAPAPVAPAPPPPSPGWFGALHGGVHYATPNRGWDPNSVVDNLKSHGYAADFNSRSQLAGAMGIGGYRGTAAQNIQMLATLNANGK